MATPTTSSTPTHRTVRPSRVVTVAVVGVLVVAAGIVFWRVNGQDTPTVPYDDPQSSGLITLCSEDGEAVTEGSTDDRPFADLAVGRSAVPSDVDSDGAVATLYAYQPRTGVAPSEFSGSAISAASLLADAEHPAARVTADAWSVGDFVTAFPAEDDGYVQLRLYLGTPQAGTLSDRSYDTADLRVDGDHWELVRGGSASCADAAALVQ